MELLEHALSFLGDVHVVLGSVCRQWHDLLGVGKKNSVQWHAVLFAFDRDDKKRSMRLMLWLMHSCGFTWTPRTVACMVRESMHENTFLLQWTSRYFIQNEKMARQVWKTVIHDGDLAAVNQFYEHGACTDQSTFDNAVKYGDQAMIAFFIDRGRWTAAQTIPRDVATIKFVLQAGIVPAKNIPVILNRVILQGDLDAMIEFFNWFDANAIGGGNRWRDYYLTTAIAAIDSIDVARWIAANGYEFDDVDFYNAVNFVIGQRRTDEPRVLTYLVEIGCPMDRHMYRLCVPGHYGTMDLCVAWRDWLHGVGCPVDHLYACAYMQVIEDENLPALRWYFEHGFDYDIGVLIYAIDEDQKLVVQWLLSAGYFTADDIAACVRARYSIADSGQDVPRINYGNRGFLLWSWQSGYIDADLALEAAIKEEYSELANLTLLTE